MNLVISLISDEFARAFAWTLFHSLWQAGIVALMAAGLMLVLRRHRPAIRYTLLCILMLLLPVFFAGTLLWYLNREIPAGNEEPLAALVNAVEQNEIRGFNAQVVPAVGNHINWFVIPSQLIDKQAGIFVMVWFAGFIFFLLRFSGALLLVYRMKNSRAIPVDERWEKKLIALSENIRLTKPVKLAESVLARVPMTIGYLKPVILLPVGTLSGLPPQQIEAILLHELAHIIRKDYVINILQSVVEILFFFHPAVWWFSGLIRQEREHICDDMVISVNQDHINYIKALTTMEELNSKSPLLANAVTGSRKKLLARVNRLITPVKFRKGMGEGIIVFLVILGLGFTLSLNALSVIPSSFDLTGRESGGNVYNLLPFNPATAQGKDSGENTVQPPDEIQGFVNAPDTIVATSKSGKVIVKVYTDSTDADDEKNVQVFVERLDNQIGDWDTILVFPDGYDTSFTTEGGFQFYGFDAPEIPEFPELQEMPDMRYYYFDDDQVRQAEKFERQLRDQESHMREFERQQKELQQELGDNMIIIENPDAPPNDWKWEQRAPEPQLKQSERIIRQELRDDGLTEHGRKYVIELDAKSMYINGEKQPKEVYRKYRKLAESLEQVSFEDSDTYKLIF